MSSEVGPASNPELGMGVNGSVGDSLVGNSDGWGGALTPSVCWGIPLAQPTEHRLSGIWLSVPRFLRGHGRRGRMRGQPN